MITTTRNIAHDKIPIPLVERVVLDGEPDAAFMQYGCKIAQKNISKGNMHYAEPVFKWFNAPNREAAFLHAETHLEEWTNELKAQASKPKIKAYSAGMTDIGGRLRQRD